MVNFIQTLIYLPLLFPHVLIYFFIDKTLIDADINRWCEQQGLSLPKLFALCYLLANFNEYRSLYYRRVGRINYILRYLRPQHSLFINTKRIGGGCYIQHGFSTIIYAESIGDNFWVNQQVTIGDSGKGIPSIGNNVRIGAGAIVIGPIKIGNDVRIGAGAIVVNDIPDGATVIGEKAKVYIV